MTDRCNGRYPVPQTSPPRDEPFEATYRCALHEGHDGPHGDGNTTPLEPLSPTPMPPLEVGDWVCVYKAGRFRYKKIEAGPQRASWEQYSSYLTNDGPIFENWIWEIRKANGNNWVRK